MEKRSLQQQHAHQHEEQPGPSGSDWMSWLKDDQLVSGLSIPGTHDSAAYTYNLPFVATQRMSIEQQLNSGIRYFDLRCGLRADILEMVHGPTYLGLRLEEVLAVMYDWIASHSFEGLIVQLKQDRGAENSTTAFPQAVMDIIGAHPQHWRVANTTPVLGDIRGKIQLFRRFRGSSITAYGINVSRWQDNPQKPFTMHVGHEIKVTVQDHYRYNDAVPLPTLVETKMAEIFEVLKLASESQDDSHWYINFTSALEFNWSYRYPPRTIAEGGWYGFQKVKGINDNLWEQFQGKARSRYGIVAMDFPDSNSELISRLIASNFEEETKAGMWPRTAAALMVILWLLLYHHVSLVDVRNFITGS